MFSTSLYAEWEPIAKSLDNKVEFYVDIDGLRKIDGFFYYWGLNNFLDKKAVKHFGFKSLASYHKADCNLFRTKILQLVEYEELMGTGYAQKYNEEIEDIWEYPPPGSHAEYELTYLCKIINSK